MTTAGCYDDEGSLKRVGSSNGGVLLNDRFWPKAAFRDVLADFHDSHLKRADAPSIY